jgi:hypothetical protein
VQQASRAFVRVLQEYDGLDGKVIRWTFEHGNDNKDPGILAWVLDPKGEELGRPSGKTGSASSFAAWLKEQSRASFPLVDPARFQHLKAEARAIAGRKNLGATLAALREKAEKEEGAAREEARELLTRLLEYASLLLSRAEALKASDPPEALAQYKSAAKDFKGDEAGRRAEEAVVALEKDPAFQRELKAFALFRNMKDLKAQVRRDRPLDSPSNRTAVAGLRSLMQALDKNYADTATAAKARALLKELGLK